MTSVVITGADQILEVLEQLDGKDRQNLERRAIRAAAKPFQAAFKQVAASHQSVVPASFLKVPAAKVSASMRRGGTIAATVRPKSPLFNIFEPGASGHSIGGGVERQARAGGLRKNEQVRVRGGRRTSRMLAGPAGKATWDDAGRKRKGAFFARGPVHHPGMSARPLTPTAFALGEPAAMEAFTAVILGSPKAGA